jgi:hypothetical protein
LMNAQVFTNAEVVSSIVLGGATLGAAGLNLLREGRKAKRAPRELDTTSRWWKRPVLFLALSVALVGVWLAYVGGVLDNATAAVSRYVRSQQNRPPVAAAVTPVKAQPAPLPGRADWLQAEGTKLYYRFARYLPDACPGTPIVIGNWADGEARPVAAECVDQEWLAFDIAPLVTEGRIVPNMTYCLNFRAESGAWGLHVPQLAPGLDSVVVPAVRVPLGRAIGVRYVKGLRERVMPTGESPLAPC